MAVRPVLRMGHPHLLRVAEPVSEFDTPELHAVLQDMFDTMAARNGVGLAAPQIDINLRIVIFGFDQNPRYPEAEPVPQTVLINPQIKVLDQAQEPGWEGCLSVPGLRGLVSRYQHIRYSGYDALGQRIEREVSGFHARVVQHEVDHLDGLLYPRRMGDLSQFGFVEELEAARNPA